ncbi:MAG: hypothetical protein EOP48_34030, partial [Sphingobacteriales bacterium]
MSNAHGDAPNIYIANPNAANLTNDTRAGIWLDNDGQLKFRSVTGNGFAFRNTSNTSDLINISGNGNLGIGTNSPQEALHINNGDLAISHLTYMDGWGKFIKLGTGNYAGGMMNLGSEKYGLGLAWDSDRLFFGLKNEGPNRNDAVISWGDDLEDNFRILFNTNEVARFNAGGNFGVGMNNPIHKLDVNGSGRFQSGDNQFAVILNDGGASLALPNGGLPGQNGAPAGKYPLRLYESYGWNFTLQDIVNANGFYSGFRIKKSNDGTLFQVRADGHVGIGTENPSEMLSVNGKILAKEIKVTL